MEELFFFFLATTMMTKNAMSSIGRGAGEQTRAGTKGFAGKLESLGAEQPVRT